MGLEVDGCNLPLIVLSAKGKGQYYTSIHRSYITDITLLLEMKSWNIKDELSIDLWISKSKKIWIDLWETDTNYQLLKESLIGPPL